MPKPQKSRLTKRADDWRGEIKRTGAKPPYFPRQARQSGAEVREGASSNTFKPKDTSKPPMTKRIKIAPDRMERMPGPGPVIKRTLPKKGR